MFGQLLKSFSAIGLQGCFILVQ